MSLSAVDELPTSAFPEPTGPIKNRRKMLPSPKSPYFQHEISAMRLWLWILLRCTLVLVDSEVSTNSVSLCRWDSYPKTERFARH
ncbi:hypothetical protein PsYK624_044590 [Phanerochaete sordida]|uniref:Uncharacterized protein n=1 Tax=Phanerochaete sordida TaxID=48140 RepID=A0A9P3LAG3_9APHY|nr:hypothetical protein PsYK624_044590 [Phanerochaete sordida]